MRGGGKGGIGLQSTNPDDYADFRKCANPGFHASGRSVVIRTVCHTPGCCCLTLAAHLVSPLERCRSRSNMYHTRLEKSFGHSDPRSRSQKKN
jgi:hypothetical protein